MVSSGCGCFPKKACWFQSGDKVAVAAALGRLLRRAIVALLREDIRLQR